jgi:hypothetical protein
MKPSVIVARLKAECPAFAGRVGNAADFEAAVENDNLTVPYAFVHLVRDTATETGLLGVVSQELVEVFGVTVAVDNTVGIAGGVGSEQLDDIREELRAAMLGWVPDPYYRAFEYVSGEATGMTRARLWHRFEFQTETLFEQD